MVFMNQKTTENKPKQIIYLLMTLAFSCLFFACDPIDITHENPEDYDSISSHPTATGLMYVYDDEKLPELHIKTTVVEWNKLLTWYDLNKNNEEYIVANFTFKKENVIQRADNVGLRIRGNTSRRRPEGVENELHNATSTDWHHASFSVKFNKFEKGQKMAGQKKINLKWFKDDAMYVREMYCYDLFERTGVWTAPQASYCKLNISVENTYAYYGVYLMVEPVNSEYISERKAKFGDNNGFLWKANWGADFVSANKNNMGVKNVTLTSTYEPIYDLKTNAENLEAAKTQLADFIQKLNSKNGDEFKNWILSTMDVNLFLKTYAVNVLCGMWDDYWNNKNNFYFYFNSQGKFFFIPYDYDNTLGTSLLMTDAGKQNVLSWGNKSHPLVSKILKIEEFKIFI